MKWRSLEKSEADKEIRPLSEIFAERKDLIAKYVPAETQAVHARAIAELKQNNLAANILPVGANTPDFQLQDHDGKTVSSTELLSKGRVVLCFIRGRWCPFCVAQMEAMNLLLPEMERAGATSSPCPRKPCSSHSSCAISTSCDSLFSRMPGIMLHASSV